LRGKKDSIKNQTRKKERLTGDVLLFEFGDKSAESGN